MSPIRAQRVTPLAKNVVVAASATVLGGARNV